MLDQNHSKSQFENKVRVRVCGILEKNGSILLLKHDQIGPKGYLWSPPGGGVEFGISLEKTLMQEFLEETNIHIEVGDFLFTNEFMDEKYHAIELFFEVKHISGELKLGKDPELSDDQQILSELRFFSAKELHRLPQGTIHNAFTAVDARDKITDLKGLITFKH